MSAQHPLEVLRALKAGAPADSLIARGDGVVLRAVTRSEIDDAELVRRLSRWRDAAVAGFPNRFRITPEGTRTWLIEQVLDKPDRIFFLLSDERERPFGQLGLMHVDPASASAVVDGVIRGEPENGPAGGMRIAMRHLSCWARDRLGLNALILYVLSDNVPALRLYASLGFRPIDMTPLELQEGDERRDWVATQDPRKADRFFLKLELALGGPGPHEADGGR